MRSTFGKLAPQFLAAAIAAPLLMSGCAVHARVYDPYYHDYHAWAGESGYYVQWEDNTHRHHEDFRKRNDDEKKEYWDWRHHHDDDRH